MSSQPIMPARLVYSYSHKDSRHRERMEEALSTLRRDLGILREWSDVSILPGQSISREIQEQFAAADIAVFLLSDHFLASPACRQEWQAAGENPHAIRVPVILTPCSWRNLPDVADIKALPADARPISRYRDKNQAWTEVHDGIRDVAEDVRRRFSLRSSFRAMMETTDFVSRGHLTLRDLFVFPSVTAYVARIEATEVEQPIRNRSDLLDCGHMLVHGEHLSGKTALCRALFLNFVEKDGLAALYVDMSALSGPPTEGTLRRLYGDAFTGDYTLWVKQPKKVLLLDNLSRHRQSIDFVKLALQHFSTILITLSTDIYYSYYRDDERFADFGTARIQPLTHVKQEELIRRSASRSASDHTVADGRIDELEKKVNAVVMSNRLLPRYPFYVLSVLQAYEGFMPHDLSISSYGHCYYVGILAHLVKAGVGESDAEITPCLNFASHLAFELHRSGSPKPDLGQERMVAFLAEYRARFILSEATWRRLSSADYGILNADGEFRTRYMYYYFLGMYLARHETETERVIEAMLEQSYRTENALTLIFTIHHATSDRLVDAIRERTMAVFSDLAPATLDRKEAEFFEDEVHSLPERVLEENSVEVERERERRRRDHAERSGLGDPLLEEPEEKATETVNDLYRVFKNNEILGHILRNKYGSLELPKVEQLVEAIADGGLRLVRLLLLDEDELRGLAAYLRRRNPTHDSGQIERALRFLSLAWAVHNIERVVAALGTRELRPVVDRVVTRRDSPAYRLIGYFLRLDTIQSLGDDEIREVRTLLRDHRYPFFKRLLSIRTQWHLATHKVREPIERAMCSALGIPYVRRPKRLS